MELYRTINDMQKENPIDETIISTIRSVIKQASQPWIISGKCFNITSEHGHILIEYHDRKIIICEYLDAMVTERVRTAIEILLKKLENDDLPDAECTICNQKFKFYMVMEHMHGKPDADHIEFPHARDDYDE